jgi:hypothetical protein
LQNVVIVVVVGGVGSQIAIHQLMIKEMKVIVFLIGLGP